MKQPMVRNTEHFVVPAFIIITRMRGIVHMPNGTVRRSFEKKSVIFALVMVMVLLFQMLVPMSVQAYEPDEELLTKGIYMVNLDTNTVVYEKSPNEKMYPASLTKIMTAIVALENCDLD